MHAVKLKGITCVVADITVSEKNEARGEAVLKMGCGATRTHHPKTANRITDAPVTCMQCMAANIEAWDPAEFIEKISAVYMNRKIQRRSPTITSAAFGHARWRSRHGVARALKFMGYLGHRSDSTTYEIPPKILDLCSEEKPDLIAIGTKAKMLGSKDLGVPWAPRAARHKKYVFTHPKEYTFYTLDSYQMPPKVIHGDIMAIKDRLEDNYGDGFRFADDEYVAAQAKEHYDQKMRTLRKEKFVETLIACDLIPPGSADVPIKISDDLTQPIPAQVFAALQETQHKAARWAQRVTFLQDLNTAIVGAGGWEAWEKQYLETLDTLIRG